MIRRLLRSITGKRARGGEVGPPQVMEPGVIYEGESLTWDSEQGFVIEERR